MLHSNEEHILNGLLNAVGDRQQLLANNLTNASTPGYVRQILGGGEGQNTSRPYSWKSTRLRGLCRFIATPRNSLQRVRGCPNLGFQSPRIQGSIS